MIYTLTRPNCSSGASFQLFLGGPKFCLFSNTTGLLKNWEKQHFICSNSTLFIVPFFLFSHFFLFSLFSHFFFLFSFFLLSFGGGWGCKGPPPSPPPPPPSPPTSPPNDASAVVTIFLSLLDDTMENNV